MSTLRSATYLAWIRTLRCVRCGNSSDHAHHHRWPGVVQKGVGMKVDDFATIPLCHVCHDHVHRTGLQTFDADHLAEHGVEVQTVMLGLVTVYSRTVRPKDNGALVFLERCKERE